MRRRGWIAAVLGLSLAGVAHAQQTGDEQPSEEPSTNEPAAAEPTTAKQQQAQPDVPTDHQALKQQLEADKEPQQANERLSNVEAEGVELSSLDEEQIKAVQTDLQEAGYYRGEIDGIPGGATQQAVNRFYRDQAKLASRGVILPEAAAAMGLQAAEVEKVSGVEGVDDAEMQPPVQEQQPMQQPSERCEHEESMQPRAQPDEDVHAPPEMTVPMP